MASLKAVQRRLIGCGVCFWVYVCSLAGCVRVFDVRRMIDEFRRKMVKKSVIE